MAGLVNAFNPCRLVLGGGIVDHAPLYIDRQGTGGFSLDASVRIQKPVIHPRCGHH